MRANLIFSEKFKKLELLPLSLYTELQYINLHKAKLGTKYYDERAKLFDEMQMDT